MCRTGAPFQRVSRCHYDAFSLAWGAGHETTPISRSARRRRGVIDIFNASVARTIAGENLPDRRSRPGPHQPPADFLLRRLPGGTARAWLCRGDEPRRRISAAGRSGSGVRRGGRIDAVSAGADRRHRQRKCVASCRRPSIAVPIVMIAIHYDPAERGYVASLARPGGNITGVVFRQSEFVGKHVELLAEAFPGRTRLAALFDAQTANLLGAAEQAAKALQIQISRSSSKNCRTISMPRSATRRRAARKWRWCSQASFLRGTETRLFNMRCSITCLPCTRPGITSTREG